MRTLENNFVAMGLDFGEKRIGVSVSHLDGKIGLPHSIITYKKVDIALIGGDSYSTYNGYKKAKDKIYCSSLDYSYFLTKKKNLKKIDVKNYAVFIDTYLPFHPEHSSTNVKVINSINYFNSLINFFRDFEKATKLKVIVALYPKANQARYPKEFKKFKIVSNKIVELVKNCKIVLHHGSTAQSYAAIFKKPIIYLTSDFIEKYKYVRDNAQRIEFLGQKELNIDNYDKNFLIKKKLFSYDEKLYKYYLNNYLKHSSSKNVPWYISFSKYFNDK